MKKYYAAVILTFTDYTIDEDNPNGTDPYSYITQEEYLITELDQVAALKEACDRALLCAQKEVVGREDVIIHPFFISDFYETTDDAQI